MGGNYCQDPHIGKNKNFWSNWHFSFKVLCYDVSIINRKLITKDINETGPTVFGDHIAP